MKAGVHKKLMHQRSWQLYSQWCKVYQRIDYWVSRMGCCGGGSRDKGFSKLGLRGLGFNFYHFRKTPTQNYKNLTAKYGTPMRQNTIQPQKGWSMDAHS